ncbi:MAG: dihydrofolate reductase [Caldimonas sp.]
MEKPVLSLLAAVARDGGIGYRGELLVRIADDLRRFKRLTLGSPIVMGRKTWEAIGRPLPGRQNIVVSRDPGWHAEGATSAASLDAAIALAATSERLFVIGGAEMYALALPRADELELTEIDAEFPADTFFPPWSRGDFRQTSREAHATPEGLRYSFVSYKRNA